MKFKSGFVSIVGNPNVGKSTLFNKLLDENLSIVTSKPQTSRNKLLGVINSQDYQIILIDTPGYVVPSYKLHNYMNSKIFSSLDGCDLIIYLTDIHEKKLNENLINTVINKKIPLYCVLNKSDLIKNNQNNFEKVFNSYNKKKFDIISCKSKKDILKVKKSIVELLPTHEPYYPKDYFTSSSERNIVEEMIRETIFLQYKEEIPYASFIQVYSFDESKDIIKIFAYIFIENESQKKIIIGKKGSGIKEIGINSRLKLEEFFKKKIFLDLSVKIKKWRSDKYFLKKNII